MKQLDYFKKVVLGDITIRDGLQHEEKFIPTDAKVWMAEQLVLAGFKRIEVTNWPAPVIIIIRIPALSDWFPPRTWW